MGIGITIGVMWIRGIGITSGGDVDNGNWFASGVNVDSESLDHYWGDVDKWN
jgi:hypothetical protein